MSFHMYFLSLCFKPWYRYCGFLNIWLNSGVTLDYTLTHFFLVSCVRKKSVPKKKMLSLCRCWLRLASPGICHLLGRSCPKSGESLSLRSEKPRWQNCIPPINLLVVQMNNKYLRVHTANTCVYSNMLLCSNKLNVILLTTVSSYKLCNFSAYTIKHHSCPSSCGVSGSLSWQMIESWRNVHLIIFMNTHIDYSKLMETSKLFLFICLPSLIEWLIILIVIPFCWCTLLTV